MTDAVMIGHYQVLEQIGSGAMGTVRIGVDTFIDRPVAIKSLKADFVSDPEFVSRFRAEAKSLAMLSHQNIATLYTPIFEAGQLHLVMELVKGKSLEAVLADRGRPLGVKQALAIVSQACDGLAYAHEMGVIHRDVKPSNLMIGQDGRVKIMDFGIARVQGSVRLTRTGAAVGTPLYMSPEQCRGEEGDERSDIYSLAIVLYEMLKGATPFTGKTDYDLVQAQIKQPPPPLVPHAPGVTPALEATIMIALAKRPDQRFPTMKAFSDALGATEIRPNATAILRNVGSLTDDGDGADKQRRSSSLDVAQSRTRSMFRTLRSGGISMTTALALVIVALLGAQGYYFYAHSGLASAPAPAPTYSAASIFTPAPAPAPAYTPTSAPPPPPPSLASPETSPTVAPAASEVAPASPPPASQSPTQVSRADELDQLRVAVRGSSSARMRAADFEFLPNGAKLDVLPRAHDAAASGSAEAEFAYGMLLLSTPDHIDIQGAFQALSAAASQDYPDAQTALGMMYQNSRNLLGPRDLERARSWFARGAQNGDAKAHFWLGCYNLFGWGGGAPDSQRAALDFNAASDGGYERAKIALQALGAGGTVTPCF